MLRYLLITVLMIAPSVFAETDAVDQYDPDRALETSQSAIGRTLGNYQFVDRLNRSVNLHDYAGKPLVISMIFTSCHHVCPMTTKHLAETTRAARDVLGDESFEIITIGFDTVRDTPDAMRAFAREQGVDDAGWRFLSGSKETIEALSEELGFIFFTSPRGYDHINQVTIVGRDSTVYRQVYGITFALPALVEPLKQLVFNRPESAGHFVSGLIDRYRLFCTVYNPASGRYEIDNSLFIQIAIGFMVVVSAAVFLWRGLRPTRRT